MLACLFSFTKGDEGNSYLGRIPQDFKLKTSIEPTRNCTPVWSSPTKQPNTHTSVTLRRRKPHPSRSALLSHLGRQLPDKSLLLVGANPRLHQLLLPDHLGLPGGDSGLCLHVGRLFPQLGRLAQPAFGGSGSGGGRGSDGRVHRGPGFFREPIGAADGFREELALGFLSSFYSVVFWGIM